MKNSLASLILLTLTSLCVAFSIGYWSGFTNLNRSDFEILVTPSSLNVYSDEFPLSIYINITIKSINGFNNPVQLSTENLPSCLSAIFEWPYPGTTKYTITCPANGEISVSLLLIPEEQCSPEVGTYAVIIHGLSGSLIHSKNVSFCILEKR